MWISPSKYTLPSNQDIQVTKDAISKLEARLADAMEALEQAHKAIDDLEQEIGERRRWIAPARILPHDILSIIILEACKQGSKTPFVLASVCRTWRAATLDTPQAWTFVHLSRIRSIDGIRILLDRSTTNPLHFNICKSQFGVGLIEELARNTDRVRCLKLTYAHASVLRYPLSNLTKLIFVGNPVLSIGNLGTSLDGTKFPGLRSLAIESDSHWAYALPAAPFPPIEELAIRTHEPLSAAFIIKNLALNLIILHVDLDSSATPHEPSKITFPRLRHLSILDSRSDFRSSWPFDADTPVLESYNEMRQSRFRMSNLHKDTRLVKQLIFHAFMDLRLFPRLCQITASVQGIRGLLSDLQMDPQRFPDLKVVHCVHSGEIESRIDAFNLLTGRNIAFIPYTQGKEPDFLRSFRLPLCEEVMDCNAT